MSILLEFGSSLTFSIRMRLLSIILLASLFLTACSSWRDSPESVESPPANQLNFSKWTVVVKAKTVFALDRKTVPSLAYVFPALRLNSNAQPMDALSYQLDEAGALNWVSSAPRATEIQTVIENKLRTRGFRILSFQELTDSQKDHAVLVFNPYYSAANQLPEMSGDTGWTSFIRITAATFPGDLNPQKKMDVMNQEAVTLYHSKSQRYDVIKHCSEYLLDHLGQNKEWSEQLPLVH